MKLLTERVLIREVAQRWADQYDTAYCRRDPEKGDIKRRLKKLDGETATAADVEAIIGNSSWTRIDHCDECQENDPPAAVVLGPERDSVTVCLPCLRKAVKLAAGVAPSGEKQ